ncbi:MAG: LytR C-terminal domain-containing protein [Actinobacteria bacterium]|nr:LytR C-terminal domain-containing protein [Actinomycetota bacterium]
MSKSPIGSITSALTVSNAGPVQFVATRVRKALTRDGWKVVKASRVQRLESVLNEIYVDNRRQRQVELLEEARKIASSL